MSIVGMTGSGQQATYEEFVESGGVSGLDHVIDPDGSIWTRFGVLSQPAWVFLNDDGTFETHNGVLSDEDFAARVEGLAAA